MSKVTKKPAAKPRKRKTDENAPTDVVPVTATVRPGFEKLHAAITEDVQARFAKQEADADQAAFMDHSDALEARTRELEGEHRSDPTAPAAKTPASTPTILPAKQTVLVAAEALRGGNVNFTDVNKRIANQLNKRSTLNGAVDAKPVLSGLRIANPRKASHVIVRARAGTGKTTTLVEGLKALRGMPTTIVPSTQQRAVWDAILESRDRCRFVAFVAFNSSIADELKKRVPAGVDAKTMHSMGFAAIRRTFKFPVPDVDENRSKKIVAELLERDLDELMDEDALLVSCVTEVVSKCKMNLLAGTPADCAAMIDRFDVDFGGQEHGNDRAAEREQATIDLVPRVLERARDVRKDNAIDYDDMVWLPVVLGLNAFRFDVLLIDEAQDLNRCQHALAKMCGDRLIFVGDDRQAIYGFAGADSESLDRLADELGATARGCRVLPLTVTRRCGRAIVTEANQYVTDFEAHESNPDGEILTHLFPIQRRNGQTVELPDAETYLPLVKDGDMILCRSNAPLVGQFFKLFRRGQPAYVMGKKDVSKTISSLVTKMKAKDCKSLIEKVGFWLERETSKEQAKKEPKESKLVTLKDRHDCVVALAEECQTIKDILARIDSMFSDTSRAGVRLSSIHKAKGLESDRVFYLAPGGHRNRTSRMQGWEWEQELNLRYVAVTRAIRELVYVF